MVESVETHEVAIACFERMDEMTTIRESSWNIFRLTSSSTIKVGVCTFPTRNRWSSWILPSFGLSSPIRMDPVMAALRTSMSTLPAKRVSIALPISMAQVGDNTSATMPSTLGSVETGCGLAEVVFLTFSSLSSEISGIEAVLEHVPRIEQPRRKSCVAIARPIPKIHLV